MSIQDHFADGDEVFLYPVVYLDVNDFDHFGHLISLKDKIVMIMIQTSYCPFCTMAKPDFYKAAKMLQTNRNIVFATIQVDGKSRKERGFRTLVQKIKPGIMGYPSYILIKNGVRVNGEPTTRSAEDLINFINTVRDHDLTISNT